MRTALTTLLLFTISLTVFAAEEPAVVKRDTAMVEQVPADEWYRSHEWDLSMWGTFVFSANPGKNHISNDDPFTPDLDPEILIDTTISTTLSAPSGSIIREPRTTNPDERVDLGKT